MAQQPKRAKAYVPYRHIEPRVGSVPLVIANTGNAPASCAAMMSSVHLALHIIVKSYMQHYCDVVPSGGVIFTPQHQEGPYVFVPPNNMRGLVLPFKIPKYFCNVPFRFVGGKIAPWNSRVIPFLASTSTHTKGHPFQISPVHCDVICSRIRCPAHSNNIFASDRMCALNSLKTYRADVVSHVQRMENVDVVRLGYAKKLPDIAIPTQEADAIVFSPHMSGYAIFGAGPLVTAQLPSVSWPLYDAAFPGGVTCAISEALRVIVRARDRIRVIQCETMVSLRSISTVEQLRECDLMLITSEVRRFIGGVSANTVITVFIPRAFASIWTLSSVRPNSINVVWLADTMLVSEIARLATMCMAASAELVLVSHLDPAESPIARMCQPGCFLDDRIWRQGSKLWMENFAVFTGGVMSRYVMSVPALSVFCVPAIYHRANEYIVMGVTMPVFDTPTADSVDDLFALDPLDFM